MIAIITETTVTLHALPYLLTTPDLTAMCQSVAAVCELGGLDAREYVTPIYDPATHRETTGDTLEDFEIGITVSRKVVAKSTEEIEQELINKRSMMSCSMRQARLILHQYNLLDATIAAVNSIGGAALIEWEYASEVQRNNPLVAAVTTQAGMSETQLDTLFIEAILL